MRIYEKNAAPKFFALFILLFPFTAIAEKEGTEMFSDSLNKTEKKRKQFLRKAYVYGGSAYTLGHIGLYRLWYHENGLKRFRLFNDNAQWKGMDKIGHGFTTWQISRGSFEILRAGGMEIRKAENSALLFGLLCLMPVEILDGFSPDYGASWGDALANTTGAFLWYGQQKLWKEQRFKFRFSFWPSEFARKRPELLGYNLQEQFLKDYNAQTYFVSADLNAFLPKFPGWLNLAAGYGIYGMVRARESENLAEGYRSFREYYLAPDLDFSIFRGKSKFLNTLIFLLEAYRLPLPTVVFSRHKKSRLFSFL